MFHKAPTFSSIIIVLLFALGFVSSLQGFFFAARATGAGTGWTVATLWFSVSAIVFFSLAVLSRNKWIILGYGMAGFSASLLFAPNIFQVGFIILSTEFLFLGWKRIRSDMNSRIRLSIFRSIGAGSFAFLIAFSLVLSSQYYFMIRDISWDDLVPKFSLAKGGGDTILRVAGYLYPELGAMRDGDIAVDDFLVSVRGSAMIGNGRELISDGMESEWMMLPTEIREKLFAEAEVASIITGRNQLSELLGRPVSGDERIMEIFSEILRNKVIAFLAGKKAESNLPGGVLPFFLSLLFFITVISVASFLQWMWSLLAAGLIWVLVRTGILVVLRVSVEQEVLEGKKPRPDISTQT